MTTQRLLSFARRGVLLLLAALPISGLRAQHPFELPDLAKLTGISDPQFSPDGKQVAYWYPRQGNTMNINEVWAAPATGGEGQNLTPTLDRDVFRAIWMPDGKALLLGGLDGNRTSLWLQPAKGGAARKLALGPVSPAWSFWVETNVSRTGGIAFVGSSPDRPAELYYLASASAAPKRLTDFNGAVHNLQLGKAETRTWQADGLTHDGQLYSSRSGMRIENMKFQA